MVTDQTDHFLVLLEKDENKSAVARLPWRSEIPAHVIANSDIKNLKTGLLLINTHNQIDPWELFPDFTTASDYGFVSFDKKSEGFVVFDPTQPEDKKEYTYWHILNEVDRNIIENVPI